MLGVARNGKSVSGALLRGAVSLVPLHVELETVTHARLLEALDRRCVLCARLYTFERHVRLRHSVLYELLLICDAIPCAAPLIVLCRLDGNGNE